MNFKNSINFLEIGKKVLITNFFANLLNIEMALAFINDGSRFYKNRNRWLNKLLWKEKKKISLQFHQRNKLQNIQQVLSRVRL